MHWGQKLSGASIDLARAPANLVLEYLSAAWAARASRQQRAAWDGHA